MTDSIIINHGLLKGSVGVIVDLVRIEDTAKVKIQFNNPAILPGWFFLYEIDFV